MRLLLICCLTIIVFPALAAADLSSGDLRTHNATIRQLRSQGSEAAVRGLATAFANPDQAVAARALQAMGDLGQPAWQVIDGIRQIAEDSERPQAREAAIGLLGHFKDDRSLDLLVAAVASDDQRIAKGARESLAAIAGRDLGTVPENWQRWQEDWLRIADGRLAHAGKALLDHNAADPVSELHTVLMFKNHRSQVADILFEMLRHEDPQVANLASSGLRNLDSAYARALVAEAGRLGILDPAYRPPEIIRPSPVEAAPTLPITAPAPPPAPADATAWVVLGGIGLVLALVSWVVWRLWREAHRQLSDRTRLYRRNRARIEFTD